LKGGPLKGVTIAPDEVASLIDEIPMLAVLATYAHGVTEVRGAEELRVKESDRIEAFAENLRRMGVEIETFPDGFRLKGPQPLKGAVVDSFGDHRIAMAFSIGALGAKGQTQILECDSVDISYPAFFDTLRRLTDG
jgi:3-phosphoshikimate 1-carboxyvinyltransferase